MTETTYIELFWDCPDCGQQAISALPVPKQAPDPAPDGFTCPTCAYNRRRSDPLYERPESRVVTDPDLIQRIKTGQIDWECKYCGSLNPQTGIGEAMLACRVCSQFQTDALSPEQPETASVGEVVAQRNEPIRDRFEVIPENLQAHPHSGATNSQRRLWLGVLLTLVIAILTAFWWFSRPQTVEITVQALPWETQVEVQQLRPVSHSDWQERIPTNAHILATQTRQRGTQRVQQGTKWVTTTERYKSGTRQETYTAHERYQSGTEQKCTTKTTGTGAGERICRDIPVYSSRDVQRQRDVPVYSSREVTTEVPNWVTEPVYDTFVDYEVDEWQPEQTLVEQGEGSDRRLPQPKLTQKPYPERALLPQVTCQVRGIVENQRADEAVQTWPLPCEQSDRLGVGDRVRLKVDRRGRAIAIKL